MHKKLNLQYVSYFLCFWGLGCKLRISMEALDRAIEFSLKPIEKFDIFLLHLHFNFEIWQVFV